MEEQEQLSKREELETLKPELRRRRIASEEAKREYERKANSYLRLKQRFDKIDRDLAEVDGRTKKISTGKSNKAPKSDSKTHEEKLRSALENLSPAEREAFMRDLLS